MKHEVICRYCDKKTKRLTSLEFYGKNYGTYVYSCTPCDAYVGSHKHSKKPLGTVANNYLRELRRMTHRSIDGYWKSKQMTRKDMYYQLSLFMGLPYRETHVGMFDEEQCKKIIEGFDKFIMRKEEVK